MAKMHSIGISNQSRNRIRKRHFGVSIFVGLIMPGFGACISPRKFYPEFFAGSVCSRLFTNPYDYRGGCELIPFTDFAP